MPSFESKNDEFQEKVVDINRVAKVVKGGRRFSLTALVVVGDQNGRVGMGIGKAKDITAAIQKGTQNAKKNLMTVPMVNTTIPHQVIGKSDAANVFLKPAAPGTGVIAGGPVRAVLELAGIGDVLSKSLGSANAINMVRATFDGLSKLHSREEILKLRSKSEDVSK